MDFSKRAEIAASERADRYTVASWLFRFWWLVVILGFAMSMWLLRSIADSLS
jgi:hypothetical protein